MKGIAYWFWVIAGIIAGLIIFTLAYQQIAGMNRITAEQKSIEQFKDIKSIIDNLCIEFGGNKREKTLNLYETVEGIYVVSSKYDEYSNEELVNKVLAEDYNTGNYLCIKIKDKKTECEDLACNTIMPFMGAVPEEFSLSALVNKLSGKGKIFDYYLTFERDKEKVNVYLLKDKPSPVKVCDGILNVKMVGINTCTITASTIIKNCNGKNWEIKEDGNIKCSGVSDKDDYSKECESWTVESGTDGKTFTYDLYIDGENKDSKSVECKPSVKPTPKCSPDEIIKNVDKNIMLENVKYLAQHSRPYGSSGNEKTAEYIKNKLESYGLTNVHFEDFDSGKGKNVVGEIGSGQTIIVVAGGHRDAVSNCPGAVDNAAGAVTVMEAARVIASCKDSIKNYKIRFVLFDGEEQGLFGSEDYVSKHSSENTGGMINLDCLGHKDAKSLRVFRSSFSTPLSKSADKVCQYLEITGMESCKRSSQVGSSDHAPFGEAGIDWIFAGNDISSTGDLGTDVCGACYHCISCQDDMTQIDANKLEWSGKFAAYVLSDLYIK